MEDREQELLGPWASVGGRRQLFDRVGQQKLRDRFTLFVKRRRQLVDRLRLQLERPALTFTGSLQSQRDLSRCAGAFAALDSRSVRSRFRFDTDVAAAGRLEGSAVRSERMAVLADDDVPPRSDRLTSATASEALRSEPVQDGRWTDAQSRCRYGGRDLAGHPPTLLAH